MTFSKFLQTKKLTRRDAASFFGVSVTTIQRWCSGGRPESIDLMVKIEGKTDGAVPVSSWVRNTQVPCRDDKSATVA